MGMKWLKKFVKVFQLPKDKVRATTTRKRTSFGGEQNIYYRKAFFREKSYKYRGEI